MLSDGDNVPTIIVIGGETTNTTGRYTSEHSALVYDLPNTPAAVIIYSDGRVFSLVMAGASGTISASIPSVEPKWEAAIPRFIPDQQTIQVPDEVNGGTRAFDPTSDQLHVFYNGSPETLQDPAFNSTLPVGLSYISETEHGETVFATISMISALETSDTIIDDPGYEPAFVYSNGGGTFMVFTHIGFAIIDSAKIKYCRCMPK
jgi:hypothetical protein